MLQLINDSANTKPLVSDYKSSPWFTLSYFTSEKQLWTRTRLRQEDDRTKWFYTILWKTERECKHYKLDCMFFRELFWKNLHAKENDDQYLVPPGNVHWGSSFHFFGWSDNLLMRWLARNTEMICNLRPKKFNDYKFLMEKSILLAPQSSYP